MDFINCTEMQFHLLHLKSLFIIFLQTGISNPGDSMDELIPFFPTPNHLIEFFHGPHRFTRTSPRGLSPPLPLPSSISPSMVSAITEPFKWNSAIHYYLHNLSRHSKKDPNKSLHRRTSVNKT